MTIYREHLAGKLVPALMIFSLTVAYPYQQAFAAKDVTKIGVTTIVKNKVLGEPPKMVQRRLKTGLEVYFNEKVETGRVGRTQLLFKDGTAITIGPNANMTIDKYVFDPNAGTGDMALSVTKGVFRIVGGRISKRKPIKLKTPVATLGVMGGIVVVDQAANGKLNADFLFGNKMTVTANNVTVTTRIPGRFISVTGSGQPPGPSQKRDRAEMKKNLEKLEGGGAEEKTAAAEETTAPKKQERKSLKKVNLRLRMIKNLPQRPLLVLPLKKKMKDKLLLTNNPRILHQAKTQHHQRKRIHLPQETKVERNLVKQPIRIMKQAKPKQPRRQYPAVKAVQCQCLGAMVDKCQCLVVKVVQCQ